MINNLLWNIRGIGNIKSRRRVVKLVKMYNISLISILEPLHHANKIQEFSNRMGFHFSLANQEADEKIWLSWNHEVNVVLVDAFEQCITVDIGFLCSYFPPGCWFVSLSLDPTLNLSNHALGDETVDGFPEFAHFAFLPLTRESRWRSHIY